MNKKTCLLTTYVAGIKYQAFIPMLVYSCKTAYPEYDIMLFLHEKLQPEIKKVLELTNLFDKVDIAENVYAKECPNMTGLQSKSCRWIMWDKKFLEYQYLYIIDVDMFYIREPMPLHEQHCKRMEKTGLPFDNMRRFLHLKKTLPIIKFRINTAGFNKFLLFLFKHNIIEERITGLHFVDVERYYTKENLELLEQIKGKIFKRYYFPEILTSNNEVLLANITKLMGYDLNRLGVQTDPQLALPFDNIYRDEFRPHHGFHLGIFRIGDYGSLNAQQKSMFTPTLESDTYKYYLSKYLEIIKFDDFKIMYANLPYLAKTYMDRLHAYYHINI